MNTDKKNLKEKIASMVARKVELTRQRRTYKVESRGKVAESERVSWFHGMDMDRSEARCEIRYALLAYAFVRGMPYRCVEAKTANEPLAHVVLQAASHAGVRVDLETVENWLRPPAVEVAAE